MKPTLTIGNAVVYHGNNLDVLPTLPDNSVDSVVCDPPYELGFMGKKWDSSGIAYSVELWTECMRVLKPGGHLLAFGGSRTWHRLAVAIEDAGFEIRDSIAWLYGSGFPKSMDISKAIDKRGGQGAGLAKQIGEALREAREKRGISKTQADQMFCDGTTNWTWFEGRPSGQRPPTPQTFARIIAEWPELQSLAELVAAAEREVIGQITKARSTSGNSALPTVGGETVYATWDETAPATDEAKQWAGWGTALKPAFEPVVVARKPLIGTVAENVLTWGVGGLNIDGSRIGTGTGEKKTVEYPDIRGGNYGQDSEAYTDRTTVKREVVDQGRWPANIILDEYTAGLLDEQSGIGTSKAANRGLMNNGSLGGTADTGPTPKSGTDGIRGHNDSGGASRFFYVAKASKKDRNEGLENVQAQSIGDKGNGLARICSTCGASVLDGCECPDRTFVNPERKNFHPTVKPTAIMEYLIKLVTPPNGTVLDPFTGSGSTGKAALLNGFKFIGIELTEEYLPIIEGRLTHAWNTAQAKEEEESETLF